MTAVNLILLVAAFVSTGRAQSTCTCFISSFNASGLGDYVPLNNAYTEKFKPCNSPCGFVADSGNASWGWSGLDLTWAATPPFTGFLNIYNGDSIAAPLFVSVNIGENVVSGSDKNSWKSSSRKIYIEYVQTSGSPATYYGSLQVVDGLSNPTFSSSTTVPFTTQKSPDVFSNSLSLISHDLLILVNPHTSQGQTGLDMLNEIANNFVNLLSIGKDIGTKLYSRLGLAYLTTYGSGFNVPATLWTLDAAIFSASLPRSGVTPVLPIKNIDPLIEQAFKVDNKIAPTRPFNERTVLFLTADPVNISKTFTKAQLENYGANLVIVSYKLSSSDKATIDTNDKWYNYVNVDDSTDASLAKFVNPFFFNSNSTNIYCNPTPSLKNDAPTAANTLTIIEPWDYIGAVPEFQTWNPLNGQQKRYCSFLDRVYEINNSNGTSLDFTVYYELEIEADFLRIYEDGVETKSFTGLEVTGAKFVSSAKNIQVRFTTDFKGVYSGFRLDVKRTNV